MLLLNLVFNRTFIITMDFFWIIYFYGFIITMDF